MATTRRTRARSLALINWKGVFYERYQLDPGVTALEGGNGAGKTTVMVAAYAVLLPDLNYLRFANVGEAARGGDRGLWGRLADHGPAYAVLELELARGERLLAGLHLERGPQPELQLEPFVVEGLPWEAPLQDLLLLRGSSGDAWPEPDELADACLRAGGRLRWFKQNKGHYFRRLFELGVTPVRGVSNEDRQKLNDMLRTCMVGGISQALRGGLRDFLLKKETRLGAAVRRMEENLLACRKTRAQVGRTRRLQHDLEEVLAAGQRMFAAALLSERARVRETGQRLAEARQRAEDARQRVEAGEATLADLTTRHRAAAAEREQAAAAADEARATLERTRQAVAEAAAARRLEATLTRERAALAAADAARDATGAALVSARRARDAALDARDQAARELADYEEAYRAIRNRVASYREATRRLDEARARLERADLDAAGLPAALAEVEADCARRGEELLALEQELELADARRRRFEAALEVARRVTAAVAPGDDAAPLEPARAGEQARALLARLEALAELARREEALRGELATAEQRAAEQAAARRRAAALGVDGALGAREGHAGAEGQAAALRSQQLDVRAEQVRVGADRDQADARRAALEAEGPRWRAVHAEAEAALAEWRAAGPATADAAAANLGSAAELAALAAAVDAERDAARDALAELETERSRARGRQRDLRDRGGDFPEALLALRDRLDATLLAERFEELPADQAPRVEAALGPRVAALVVADVEAAARAAAEAPDLATVWLIDQAALDDDDGAEALLAQAEAIGDSALLVEAPGGAGGPGAWRLSRLPQRPVLGRAARQRELAALEARLDELDRRRDDVRRRREQLDALSRRLRALAPAAELLEAPDPAAELEVARAEVARAERRGARLTQRLERLEAELAATEERRAELAALLPLAALLDPPAWEARRELLIGELRDAAQARGLLGRVGDDRQALRARLADLDAAPPTPERLEELRQAAQQAEAALTRRREPLVALRYLVANAEHLTWGELEAALEEQTPLRERLLATLERARGALEGAEAERAAAEAGLDAAREARSRAHAQAEATASALTQRRQALAELAVADPTPAGEAAAERRHERAAAAAREAAVEERRLNDGCVREGTRLERFRDEQAAHDAEAGEAARAHAPNRARLERLEASARDAGVLAGAVPPALAGELGGAASVQLSSEASSERRRLATLLGHAEGGAELANRLTDWAREGADEAAGEQYLRAWCEVRTWLQERLPAHLSQADDPLQALADLARHLQRLEERLREKEEDLRQDTRGIANSIRSRVRTARSLVRARNRDLQGVRFGSVLGVQLQVNRVERMTRLLDALAGDEALFQQDLPVEEALGQLFQSLGGGRVEADRLLDYRAYLDLRVRVERPTGWQEVSGNELSTGEAIGVGAAVMMVILKAWEEAATQLRKKTAAGSLRLLFLDEANRLSGDSLDTLFELCGSLDLQLLIAAPEVANAHGATVYRLVRSLDEQGREQVVAAGRRLAASAPG